MARKRKTDEPEGGAGIADPPPHPQQPEQPPAGAPPVQPGGPPPAAKNRPAASFAAMTDRTTRVEVAVWARQVRVGEAEEYTQYSLTLTRSWRDTDGTWTPNPSYRAHDVPVLLFLVQQAYHWCLAQRTDVKVEAAGDVPF